MKKMIPILLLCLTLAVCLCSCGGSGQPSGGASIISRELDLTEEQEAEMLTLFEQCGIGEIKSFKLFQDGVDENSYFLDDENTAGHQSPGDTIIVWIVNETKEVESIYYRDQTIYADGQVQAQVTDFVD